MSEKRQKSRNEKRARKAAAMQTPGYRSGEKVRVFVGGVEFKAPTKAKTKVTK